MKAIGKIIGGLVLPIGLLAAAGTGRAQNNVSPQNSFSSINLSASLVQAGVISLSGTEIPTINSLTDEQLTTFVNVLDATPTISAAALPRAGMCGTFWSLQYPNMPPLPGDTSGSAVWPMSDGSYLLNDVNFDYSVFSAVALATGPQTNVRMSMMASSLASSYAYGNPVYLTNMTASSAGDGSMTASFGIGGGTNFVPYDILMTTDLTIPVANWNWLGIGYTSNKYSFYEQPANLAFYLLAKPAKTMTVVFGWDGAGQCEVPFGLTNALQVASGYGQNLALKADGTVVAWGGNDYGEGAVPTNLTGVSMISAGWYHDVALLTNGTVLAWGIYDSSLFGGLPITNVQPDLTNATVISAQALHTLALRRDGTVVAWGYNASGETNVPAGLSNVVAISAGFEHSLAVANGTVVAWGNNNYNQRAVPAGLSNVVDVAAGLYHSLALLNNGTVVAWGADADGERDVPTNLTNVVAIAAGGYLNADDYSAYSMALKSDGTVVVWGDDDAVDPVCGMSNVVAIAAGAYHASGVRTGPPTPVITLEPVDEYQLPGGNVTFTARGAGLYGVTYQWQTNGVNIPGATNSTLTVTSVQTAQLGWPYAVVVTDRGGMGSILSSNAYLHIVTPPVITSLTLPTNQVVIYQSNLVLNVVATAPGTNNGFPISYQWQLNGTNIIVGANGAAYTIHGSATSFGIYSVLVSNAAGSTNASWQVAVFSPSLVISQQPTNQYQIAGGSVHFLGSGVASSAVTYQWAFAGTNLAGATNAMLTLTNVQAAQQGYYHFSVSDGIGSLTSSNASFYLVTPPVIVSQTLPTNLAVMLQSNLNLNVAVAAPGFTNGFPLHYQWQFNGANIYAATGSNYSFQANSPGVYTVVVTNAAGSTNASWWVNVPFAGDAFGWGANGYDESTAPPVTNLSALAAGEYHSVAVADTGSVIQWGYHWGDVPSDLTNAVAVAAGYDDSIALRSDGTVVTWGTNASPANYVPSGLAGVKAVACGWDDNVVLLTNGTVMAWGYDLDFFGWGNLTAVPAGLTNATAISANALHALALTSAGQVVAWGDDREGQSDVPVGLSNVVAVAAGEQHSLALKVDGTVTAWGYNHSGQCNVPAGLSNVLAIAAGGAHSVALKNDGTVVSWGDNSAGQTNATTLTQVKLIAASGNHTLASIFSRTVMYPVDVSKDLLLIYNTNSADSSALANYYLAHRPMIAGANVLGVGCDTNEQTTANNCDAQIVAPVLNWLTNNPTKHPQYLVMFFDMPTRIHYYDPLNYPSVTYRLYGTYPGTPPFITYINGGTLADCEAYVDKLAYIGMNYSPGKLIISANAGIYGNTNYYFEDTGAGGVHSVYTNYPFALPALQGVTSNGVSFLDVDYQSFTNALHITQGTNVAGYLTWGDNGGLGGGYATNGIIHFSRNSSWYLIETIESFNGQRFTDQGNFIRWFSANAFGGTNYANTPVGAVTSVEEPQIGGNENSQVYFGLWAAGKNFAICAWKARSTSYFQAVGDPLVTK